MWDHEALKVKASRDPPFTKQPHLFWLPSLALLTSTKAEIQSRSFLFRTFLQKTQPQRLLGHGRTGGKGRSDRMSTVTLVDLMCTVKRQASRESSTKGHWSTPCTVWMRKMHQGPAGRERGWHSLELKVKPKWWGNDFTSELHAHGPWSSSS